MSLLTLIARNIGSGTSSQPPSNFVPVAADTGILVNTTDGRYRGFPHTAAFSDGQIAMFYKDSDNHAAAGALQFSLSNGLISNYNFSPIVINGSQILAANIGMGMGANDRLVISWQESDLGPIRFAYTDNRGQTWAEGTSNYNYPADYSSAQFGKILKLSGGRLLQFYYCIPMVNPNDPSIAGCIKSDDNGATWQHLSIVASRPPYQQEGGNTALTNGTGYTSEIYGVVTQFRTNNNDDIVVMLRFEEVVHGAQVHYRSSDGGVTWEHLGINSLFDKMHRNNVQAKWPVHMINHKGLIYIFQGSRGWNVINVSIKYYLEYCTATPANLFNNTGYSDVIQLPYEVNADDNGQSHDFGYPEPLSRVHPEQGIDEILLPFYDTTLDSTNENKNIMIYQTKISGV